MSADEPQPTGVERTESSARGSVSGDARRARRRRSKQAEETKAQRPGLAPSLILRDLNPIIALIGFSIFGSVLAVGAVHVGVVLALAPFALAAGALAIRRDVRRFADVPAPAWIVFGLALYSALQAVPLPAGVVRALSPASSAIWERMLSPLGISTAWQSLSLDPGATLVEALKWLCYGSLFLSSAVVARDKSRRLVPAIVFGAAFASAFVTIAHRLVGAESLYGIYTPVSKPSFALAPLLNPNNFAGYLNLGGFAGLGLLMTRNAVAPRWLIGLGVSVVIGMSAVCGSRAGLASLGLGMIALLVLLWFSRLEGQRLRSLMWVPLLALVGGVALFLLAVDRGLWQSMLDEGAKKFALIAWTKPVVAQFPLFGIGRGAFSSVFPAFRGDTGHHLYEFAENFVMQWVVEWGLPLAAAACLGLAYTLRPKRLGARSDVLALCCSLGVGVLLLQNLLDLALEVASVSFALFALLGSLWARRRGPQQDRDAVDGKGTPRIFIGFVGVAVLCWATAAIAGSHPVSNDRDAIAELTKARAAGDSHARAVLPDELWAAIRRHPADAYFPLVATIVARGQKGAEMAWIARAIERDPMAGRSYLVLAEALARRKADAQALHAISLAVEREYALIGPGVTLALSMTKVTNELMHAVPPGPNGVGILVQFARQSELQADRHRLLQEAASRNPNAFEPRVVRAEDLLSLLETSADECSGALRSGCAAELRDLIARIGRIDPSSDRPTLFSARLLMVEGSPTLAQQLLSRKCASFAEQADCARLRFIAAEHSNDAAMLEESTAALLAVSCSSPTACAGTATWLAQRFAARGQLTSALHMYERAAQEVESADAWRHVAEQATQLGLNTVAASALRKLERDQPGAAAELTRTLEKARASDPASESDDGGIAQ